MKEKLIQLVECYFNEKEIVQSKEAIQEISGNLIERYEELVSEGISESEAFEKCSEYLGDLKSISAYHNVKEIAYSKPISLYFVMIFSGLSIIAFFLNTLVSLLLLILAIIVYNIELKRQYLMYKINASNMETFTYIIKKHKLFSFIWAVISNLIILETLLVMFSNLDKLTISLLFTTEPYGVFLIITLILNGFVLIPFIMINNRLVLQCESITEEDMTTYKITKLFTKKQQVMNLIKFKNLSFVIIAILTLMNIDVTILSKVSEFGLAANPITEEIIGWVLIRKYSMWQHLIKSNFNFGTWVLIIVGISLLTILVMSIFVSKIRSRKLFLGLNTLWFISVLIYAFVFNLYTGINHDMSLSIWYSLGVVMILYTYVIVYNTWKVLCYE